MKVAKTILFEEDNLKYVQREGINISQWINKKLEVERMTTKEMIKKMKKDMINMGENIKQLEEEDKLKVEKIRKHYLALPTFTRYYIGEAHKEYIEKGIPVLKSAYLKIISRSETTLTEAKFEEIIFNFEEIQEESSNNNNNVT